MKKRYLMLILIMSILLVSSILYFLYPVNHQEKVPFPEYGLSGNGIYPTNFESYDIAKFKGKEVYYFLKSIKRLEFKNESCLVDEGEPGELYGWQFTYSDSIIINIYVQDFKFLKTKFNSFEESQFRSWNVKDFLKEEISGIKIYKKSISGYGIISEVR